MAQAGSNGAPVCSAALDQLPSRWRYPPAGLGGERAGDVLEDAVGRRAGACCREDIFVARPTAIVQVVWSLRVLKRVSWV